MGGNGSKKILTSFHWVMAVTAVAFSALIAWSLALNVRNEHQRSFALARLEALATFNKDQAFRLWATRHGGVYVPATAETPPSPYLSHIPERDLFLPSGRHLTLMNPAYILRQTMQQYYELYGVKGHLTSLNVLSPGNEPDAWERSALKAFNSGAQEVMEITELNGKPVLRLMRPMIAEQGCLKCHGSQGYKRGDIRGGIGVAVPLAPYLATEKEASLTLWLSHLLIWLLGMTGLGIVFARGRTGIIERAKAEDELQKVKNYLANIIDSMPAILVGMDLDKTVTQWNQGAARATGIPADQAQGRPIGALLQDFAPWIESLGAEVMQRRPASEERLLIEKEGERHFYDLMLYPLIANGVEGTVVRIEDVTERARIQELIIQTEKMMSIGGLAAGMAHEINNPLGIINQAVQNIERRLTADLAGNREAAQALGLDLQLLHSYFEKRQIDQFIGCIQEAADRAARIVSNMLQFSRQSALAKEPTALAELIDRTVELAANDYDLKKRYDFRSIEIVREYEPTLPLVPVVTVEIEQVILNLLKNAAQAMIANPPGRKPRIVLRLIQEAGYAILEVEDNGPGMTEEVRRRVFEPFFTTKEPGVGTGLGLSVSFTIVTNNHQGLMAVDSAPGAGASFTVRLPLAQQRDEGQELLR